MSDRYEDQPRSIAEFLTARRVWFDIRDPSSPIIWEDEIVADTESNTSDKKPRDYHCAGCDRPARPLLTDEEYSSPEYEFLPKKCSICGAHYVRMPVND